MIWTWQHFWIVDEAIYQHLCIWTLNDNWQSLESIVDASVICWSLFSIYYIYLETSKFHSNRVLLTTFTPQPIYHHLPSFGIREIIMLCHSNPYLLTLVQKQKLWTANCIRDATYFLSWLPFHFSYFSTQVKILLFLGYWSSAQRATTMARSGCTPPHTWLQLQVTTVWVRQVSVSTFLAHVSPQPGRPYLAITSQ